MTPSAIRQFVALCGGDCIAKGARVDGPLRNYDRHEAFVIGQTDYIAVSVACGNNDAGQRLLNLFPQHTPAAAAWAAGKLYERTCERAVVAAYAARRMV